MANKFISFLETVGKDFEKGLAFAVTEAPVLDPILSYLFPGSTVALSTANTALTLVQNTVLSIEQKYAAAGQQGQTGTQKLADVMAVVTQPVISLLTIAGVSGVDSDYVTRLVNLIVLALNFKAPVSAAAITPA